MVSSRPGPRCNTDEKLEIATQLARLGVDVIEAGFPASSPGDLDAVQRIAREVQGPTICGLARCVKGDIDAAWEAIQDAEKRRIHVFIATSRHPHGAQAAHDARAGAGSARARWWPMPARCVRTSSSRPRTRRAPTPSSCTRCWPWPSSAGATTLNIPDTVGYTTPDEFGALIRDIRAHTPGIEKAIISVHCHNDLGLAVANSLAGVLAGARQVECTINGLGERAGNAALEEIVMALHTRAQLLWR